MTPELISVSSSNIEAVGYDESEQTLWIEFRGRNGKLGSLYRYSNVPPEVWHGLLRAPSKGAYLSGSVKGRYASTKIQ